jgi:O-antigen ligase
VLGDRVRRAWQFAGVIAFGVAFATVMPVLARAGVFGPTLRAKTVLQDSSGLPLLLVGRTEPPMSIQAIMERPLLGWGSATNLTPDFFARAEHLARRWGYDVGFPFEGYWRLPPNNYTFHSVLLGSWAEGGVLAALLPAWLLVACAALVWNFTRYGRWAPLVIVVGLQSFWDILYNPWMYNAPAVYACVALLFCARHFRGRPAPP